MNKKLVMYVAGLLVIFAVLAMTNFFGTGTGEGITIISGDTEKTVALAAFKTKELLLTTTNGKGEKTEAKYKGVELSELLTENGFKLDGVDSIEVAAQDKFTAKFTGDEVRERGVVYIVVEKNGETLLGIDKKSKAAQIIATDDKDSKRCVNYLEKITLNGK